MRGIIEKLLLDVMFEIPGDGDVTNYDNNIRVPLLMRGDVRRSCLMTFGKSLLFKAMTIDRAYNNFLGSNVESVEVTEEAVKGMSGPTFYYAEVG